MSFAENLQYLRKRDKITQEELAELLQVSRQAVSKWETGDFYPETEKLIILCDKFGVTLDELLRGDVTKCESQTKSEVSSASAGEVSIESKPTERKSDETDRKKSKSQVLGESFGGFIMISCLVAYLCMGCFANLWHPGWLVFLGGITLCMFLGSFFANDGGHDEDEERDAERGEYQPTFLERMFGGLAATSMMTALLVFLCLGFFANLWHPGWISFIAGGALSSVFGGLAHYFRK
ncbi:MAG: helix-turn-helix transcriptional regulator [Candidatus Coproplasma sp.]